MTLRCWMVARENELREDHGTIPGFWSSVDIGRRYTRQRRKDRRTRRAKRQTKATAKRVRLALQRFADRVGLVLGQRALNNLTMIALGSA